MRQPRLIPAALLVATMAIAACATPVGLRTATARFDACDQALLAGELVGSNQSGLAVRTGDGVTEVLWPFGYSATRETTGLVLRDETGRILVHEGQRVEMAGGLGAGDVWTACAGTIKEISNTGG
jgi:hypothetical protein